MPSGPELRLRLDRACRGVHPGHRDDGSCRCAQHGHHRSLRIALLAPSQPTPGRYALRFHAYGRREYVTLGSAAEGWNRAKAETELSNLLADVRRGSWRQAAPEKPPDPLPDPTFHEFASEWLARRRAELRPSTQYSYEWALRLHLPPFFARHRLSEITVAEVDRYRTFKVGQGQITARSINQTITRLAQILEYDLEYEFIARNTARGRRRRVKAPAAPRPWLDRADHITALLDAAGQLDRQARRDRKALARRATLATLTFSGLRISELCALPWRDVDLATGRLTVRASKTEAGMRRVDLLPVLRRAAHSQGRRARHRSRRARVLNRRPEEGATRTPSATGFCSRP